MDAETAAKLRAPFAPENIGKLPRVFCRACRESSTKVCQQHQRAKCRDCGNNITTAHLHLDYVGHAEITDRLLQADPQWAWEPVAFTPEGLPATDRNGGLWIRLTVAGVTRLGYGAADGKNGPDAVKETIGDALRNAAMRFGVALDLWGASFKGEDDHDEPPPAATPSQAARFDELAKGLAAAESEAGLRAVWQPIVDAFKTDQITTVQANALRAELDKRKAEFAGTPA